MTRETDALEALLDAMEAGVAQARRILNEDVSWNPDKLEWVSAEGQKGPFEKSTDVGSLNFRLLVKDLHRHNGRLTRDGVFYWLFQSGGAVGRKKASYAGKGR